ncbi:MAG TPA: hypothetical protein DCG34_01050 [Clostridiales bacterium]|nr:hypothetical protein [Clostridiales bacterium]
MTKKYFGRTGGELAVIAIVAFILAAAFNVGGVGDYVSGLGTGSVKQPVSTLALSSSFVSVVSDNNTLADSSSNNYVESTGVITIPVDAEVSNDGTATTFIFKTKNVTGSTIELMNFTETGVVTTPTTDQSVLVSVSITESVEGGLLSTDQVGYALIKVSASGLIDNSGNSYYPIAVRTTNKNLPAVYVDGTLDQKQYPWTLATADKNIDVTFNLSMAGFIAMDDLQKIPVDITLGNTQDGTMRVEFIKIAAL